MKAKFLTRSFDLADSTFPRLLRRLVIPLGVTIAETGAGASTGDTTEGAVIMSGGSNFRVG